MAIWTVKDRDVDINPPEASVIDETWNGEEILDYEEYREIGGYYYKKEERSKFFEWYLPRLEIEELYNLMHQGFEDKEIKEMFVEDLVQTDLDLLEEDLDVFKHVPGEDDGY